MGSQEKKLPRLLSLAKVYFKGQFLKFHWSGHYSSGGHRAYYLLGAPLRRAISTSPSNICIFCLQEAKDYPYSLPLIIHEAPRASAAKIPVHSLPWLQRISLIILQFGTFVRLFESSINFYLKVTIICIPSSKHLAKHSTYGIIINSLWYICTQWKLKIKPSLTPQVCWFSVITHCPFIPMYVHISRKMLCLFYFIF